MASATAATKTKTRVRPAPRRAKRSPAIEAWPGDPAPWSQALLEPGDVPSWVNGPPLPIALRRAHRRSVATFAAGAATLLAASAAIMMLPR